MTASEAKEILESWAIGMKPYHGHETEEDVKRLDALWMGIHALTKEENREHKGFWARKIHFKKIIHLRTF